MLTYHPGTSNERLRKVSLVRGITRWRFHQNSEKSEQTKGDVPDFVVGKLLVKFLLINGFEFLDGLAAQLLWCLHGGHFTRALSMETDGWICRFWQVMASDALRLE